MIESYGPRISPELARQLLEKAARERGDGDYLNRLYSAATRLKRNPNDLGAAKDLAAISANSISGHLAIVLHELELTTIPQTQPFKA